MADHLKKSMAEEAHRIKKRMKAAAKHTPSEGLPEDAPPRTESPEPMDPSEQFEGIWNLHGERPPPSSIAARKDTVRPPCACLEYLELTMHNLQMEARKLVRPQVSAGSGKHH